MSASGYGDTSISTPDSALGATGSGPQAIGPPSHIGSSDLLAWSGAQAELVGDTGLVDRLAVAKGSGPLPTRMQMREYGA